MEETIKNNLSIRWLKVPEKGRLEIKDSRIQGLWLRAKPSGTKSFVVRGYLHGKPVSLTLGQYPIMSLQGELRQGNEPRHSNHGGDTTFAFTIVFDDYVRFMDHKDEPTGRPSLAYR